MWPICGRKRSTSTLYVKGDQSFHPFLWARGKLTDLGTFGGDFGFANWINPAGDVTGWATTDKTNGTAHGALWKNGVMIDLDGATSRSEEHTSELQSRQ